MVVKDALAIAKIAGIVASMFNLNISQEEQLKQYAKYNANTWVIARKQDHEVEEKLKCEARIIAR